MRMTVRVKIFVKMKRVNYISYIFESRDVCSTFFKVIRTVKKWVAIFCYLEICELILKIPDEWFVDVLFDQSLKSIYKTFYVLLSYWSSSYNTCVCVFFIPTLL